MNRIIRTALASVGAAVVITGGSLGIAYATTPTAPAQTSASSDADQVAALNQAADDLLAKIATLEKQLASSPAPTSSASQLTKQEIAVQTTQTPQTTFPAGQVTTTTAQAPTPAAASPTAQRTGEKNSTNGNTND